MVVGVSQAELEGRWGGPDKLAADDDSTVESGDLPVRLGTPTLDAAPVLLVAPQDLDALTLDPTARTLVAFVNDTATVAEILVATKTDLVEVLFEGLAEDGIVAFV